MSIFSLGAASTVGTVTAPCFDVRSGSAGPTVKLMEYAMMTGATTASTFGLGRPANDATPPVQTGTTVLLAEDPGVTNASVTATASTWSTAPTVPAQFFRRAYLPNVIGAGIIFTFPRGLAFIANRGLVHWNIAASTALAYINLVADE